MKRRNQSIAGIGALLVALAVGTWLVFVTPPPETVRAQSADGRVSVFGGAAPSLGALSVQRRDDLAGSLPSGVGPVYDITLGGAPLPAGFDVEIRYDATDLKDAAPNRLAIHAFDRATGTWVSLPSVTDPGSSAVSTQSTGSNAVWWTLKAR